MATHKQVVRNLKLYNGAIEFFKKNKASLIKVGSAVLLASTLLTGCAQTEATPNTPTAPVEVEKTYMEELVETYGEQYQHLKWLDKDCKTLNLNGSTYDITDEKAEYGDLWMFAVDISKEDVESTFDYIVQLEIEEEEKSSNQSYLGGLTGAENEIFGIFADVLRPQMETLSKTTDVVLTKYNEYYFQRFDGNYGVKHPSSLNSMQTSEAIGNDNKDIISFEVKNWYIRDYMLRYFGILQTMYENNQEPKYFFAEELSKAK